MAVLLVCRGFSALHPIHPTLVKFIIRVEIRKNVKFLLPDALQTGKCSDPRGVRVRLEPLSNLQLLTTCDPLQQKAT